MAVLDRAGTGSPGQQFGSGRVELRVSVTDPVSGPVFVVFARAILINWFELLSKILVIAASSAESEGHFSNAGKSHARIKQGCPVTR